MRFHHVHLRSPDPEATARFYVEMFSAAVRASATHPPRLDMQLGGQLFYITPVKDPRTGAAPEAPYRGLEHIGLQVDALDAACAALKAKGAEFTLNPTDVGGGMRIAFLRGPERVSIELVELREP